VRVSLVVGAYEGCCIKCKSTAMVMSCGVFADGRAGSSEPICAACMFNGAAVQLTMEELAPGPAPRKKAMKKNKRMSVLQERDIQEELGALMQPGSGNQPGKKGDHRQKGLLRLEAKATRARSFRLELADLDKIRGEATFGEMPAMVIDFVSPGTGKLRGRFVVIQSTDFRELNGARTDKRSQRPA
jgi:hypothetical protein